METHYVQCPSCGRNHCLESSVQEGKISRSSASGRYQDNIECKVCDYAEAHRNSNTRDQGEGHNTDCRFLRHVHGGPLHHHGPVQRFEYLRHIPGYGEAVDFDLPVHAWNCTGHAHCKHGTLGVVEQRAPVMMRSSYNKYIQSRNNCDCVIGKYCPYQKFIA